MLSVYPVKGLTLVVLIVLLEIEREVNVGIRQDWQLPFDCDGNLRGVP